MEKIKCTESALNKIITWSSSRYNAWKKSDVIKDIIFRVETGDDCVTEYSSGCYSERAHQGRFNCQWSGGEYTLEIKSGVACLYNYNFSDYRKPEKIDGISIEKPKKFKYYIPAKRIRYTPGKNSIIEPGEYDIKEQHRTFFVIEDERQTWHIDKKDCIVID